MNTDIIFDTATTPEDKNLILSQYLNGPWRNLNIIRIDRIKTPTPIRTGWQVTFI